MPYEPERHGYTSPKTGGPTGASTQRNRNEHTQFLTDRLSQAWSDAGERQVVAESTRNGIYLEFIGTNDLPLKSLESVSRGIRVLTAKVLDTGDEERRATVYVPKSENGYFLKKICKYTEDTEKGKPKNEKLVSNITDIRDAVLASFWADHQDLIPGDKAVYVETWLSTNADQDISEFRDLLAELGIEEHPRRPVLKFPERCVVLIRANYESLLSIIDGTDMLAEFRLTREPSEYFVEASNSEQAEWVEDLLGRLSLSEDRGVSVCLLDTGVNAGHPLLSPILAPEDLHAVSPEWGTSDHHRRGHGTGMAGLAGYGDLHAALVTSDPIVINHRLESSKILPPRGQNKADMYGQVTAEGIARAEIQAPSRRRVICLSATVTDTRVEGKPTSWSAAVDQLASGALDGTKRLILVSAGNVVDPFNWSDYPESNKTISIEDPAQAWNAVTVGAYTTKTAVLSNAWEGYQAVAPAGALSPYSSTSYTWPKERPIKPDVLFEGGNIAKLGGNAPIDVDDLQVLSTSHNLSNSMFTTFGMTSGATAIASNFAALIWTEYPDLWPETVRGLLVHSARWSDAMKSMFLESGNQKGRYRDLLKTCGYGVPQLDIAQKCLSNRLTMITQNSLQPYRSESERIITNELHLYDLPWPKDALEVLGEVDVEMRITLSYFIEPGPGETRYRYPSHLLRFELNSPSEAKNEFLKRINKKARDEEYTKSSNSAADHWTLGGQRDVGSLHSDVWTGTAAQLATSNIIAVYPVTGWWKERDHLNMWNKTARYSLIVSIHSPATEVDIYTPVANQIMTPIEVEITTD